MSSAWSAQLFVHYTTHARYKTGLVIGFYIVPASVAFERPINRHAQLPATSRILLTTTAASVGRVGSVTHISLFYHRIVQPRRCRDICLYNNILRTGAALCCLNMTAMRVHGPDQRRQGVTQQYDMS